MSANTQGGFDTPSILYRQGKITLHDIWTVNGAMNDCIEHARVVAPTDISVLLLGETGTGKNLLARAIHNKSPRCAFPFVPANIASLSGDVLSSELFGSVPGAFTGAVDRAGYFEEAHRGTLFIDEIGALEGRDQSKILNAVEGKSKSITRLGSTKPIQCDVRLITATNCDLDAAVQEGTFRRDLYERINRFTIRLPPLRDRPDDIPFLARRFLPSANEQYGRHVKDLSEDCLAYMREYQWPGNVRELRNKVNCGVALYIGDTLQLAHVFPGLCGPGSDGPSPRTGLTLEENERRHILYVLSMTGWNLKRAAELLGISRPTLYDKIKKHSLERPPKTAAGAPPESAGVAPC